MFIRCFLLSSDKQTFMDYVMRRRSTVGGALEMFSLPLPLPLSVTNPFLQSKFLHYCTAVDVDQQQLQL